jgi:hypothetical protein
MTARVRLTDVGMTTSWGQRVGMTATCRGEGNAMRAFSQLTAATSAALAFFVFWVPVIDAPCADSSFADWPR